MIRNLVPTGNAHKSSINFLRVVIGNQFYGCVFDYIYEAKGGNQDRKYKDKNSHPLPIVDKIEGCRVQKYSNRK
jgi:hypothetical protein